MKAGVAGSATVKSKSFATITLIACQHQRAARSNLALRFKNGHAIVLQAEHAGALAVCVAARHVQRAHARDAAAVLERPRLVPAGAVGTDRKRISSRWREMQVGGGALVHKVAPVPPLQREEAVGARRQRRAAVPAARGSGKQWRSSGSATAAAPALNQQFVCRFNAECAGSKLRPRAGFLPVRSGGRHQKHAQSVTFFQRNKRAGHTCGRGGASCRCRAWGRRRLQRRARWGAFRRGTRWRWPRARREAAFPTRG